MDGLVNDAKPHLARYATNIGRLVGRGRPTESGCIEWPGYKNHLGYGRAMITLRDGSIRLMAVHRLAYELHHGPIPDGLVVMHTCDNRACLTPGHLRIGTQADNLQDMHRKGRYRNGRRKARQEVA